MCSAVPPDMDTDMTSVCSDTDVSYITNLIKLEVLDISTDSESPPNVMAETFTQQVVSHSLCEDNGDPTSWSPFDVCRYSL